MNSKELEEKKNGENKSRLCVGYLVPSKKVKGELEFKKFIESQQQHINVYYCLKDEFNLEEEKAIIIAEVEDLEGYHLLEPLYKNEKTGSVVYVDTLNAITYNSNKLITGAPAFDIAVEQVGYQLSYSKEDMQKILGNMNQKGIENRIEKRK